MLRAWPQTGQQNSGEQGIARAPVWANAKHLRLLHDHSHVAVRQQHPPEVYDVGVVQAAVVQHFTLRTSIGAHPSSYVQQEWCSALSACASVQRSRGE